MTLVNSQTVDGIATIQMNRPEKRNALSVELIDALNEAVDRIAADASARVMILGGAGRSFCAGMDLQGVLDDASAMANMLHRLAEVSWKIRQLPMPTIAQVQGAAVGGGCGLMVVTDFCLTHAEAKLGYPEVNLGVCPAVVAPWLIQRIGAGRARSMLLGGGTIRGDEAVRIGLATHLCAVDELETRAQDLAKNLAGGGKDAISVTKLWLNELDGSLDPEVGQKAAALSARVIAGSEAQERLARIFGGG